MAILNRKSPWEKEWKNLQAKENKFTARRMEGPTSVLVGKLDRFVPDKLTSTLNAAFFKGFSLIFEKGTGVIEKTYNKERKEKDFQINTYATELGADKRSVRSFTRQARAAKKVNLLVSSVEGIGLGLIGAGVPDIPLFIAMVLKSVYEIALSYGYRYDTEEEKVFILKLIQVAMMDGEEFQAANEEFNQLIEEIVEDGDSMEGYRVNKIEQMRATSEALSAEMIYTKFLQGQLIIGIAGGIFDPIYVNRISDYAVLKYRRRFLRSKEQQGLF
ncbi:MAG: EcsC family protein [Firmicutes bacterium]|nr:EcsC family protein [Bacillota bacterium]